jgi:hypothetical protein
VIDSSDDSATHAIVAGAVAKGGRGSHIATIGP